MQSALKELAEEYNVPKGNWFAVLKEGSRTKIVAIGSTYDKAEEGAQAKGIKDPELYKFDVP